ncbi:MAG TPA: hypothetical protein VI168_15575 [Croceibacterium sp.]
MLTHGAALLALALQALSGGVSIEAQRAERESARAEQAVCNDAYLRYGAAQRETREGLQQLNWDLPDGFVDPSAINAARYTYQDLHALVRDETDRIMRSYNPSGAACRGIAERAERVMKRYTNGIVHKTFDAIARLNDRCRKELQSGLNFREITGRSSHGEARTETGIERRQVCPIFALPLVELRNRELITSEEYEAQLAFLPRDN